MIIKWRIQSSVVIKEVDSLISRFKFGFSVMNFWASTYEKVSDVGIARMS